MRKKESLNSGKLDDLLAAHAQRLIDKRKAGGMSDKYANRQAEEQMVAIRNVLDVTKAKAELLDMLTSGRKTALLVPPASGADWNEIQEFGKLIREDADIAAALDEAGVIGHLDYGHNRYAQGPTSLKFRITQSKTGKSGWSSWS